MTIEEAVKYLMKSGFVAKAIKNNTEVFGGTKEIPLGDIIGIRNAFVIYPDKGIWIVVLSASDKTVQAPSLFDAVRTVINLVSPLLDELSNL